MIQQGNCPKCGEGIGYGDLEDVEFEADRMLWPCKCGCGFEGKEVSSVKFLGFLDGDDPDGDLI